ncbi:MAG: ABC transporter permease [Flavobacteriales bacterium]|nr:ABC transporter permease [Flavobacteriales bacterium]
MNLELFIAKKIISGKNESQKSSKAIVKVATFSIALGLTIMILSLAILNGYRNEISSKVIGFDSHIQISNFDNSNYDSYPINQDQPFIQELDTIPEIKHIQVYAFKSGIINSKEGIYGIFLKGVDEGFNWDFFESKLVEGNKLSYSDTSKGEIVLSKFISQKLKLKLNDYLYIYFLKKDKKRIRKFHIVGIYETGLVDFDKIYALTNIDVIQKLNDWDSNQVGGFDLYLHNLDHLEELNDYVYEAIGSELISLTVNDIHPEIFSWLELQNVYVKIILVLMVLIASINIISTLLITILEGTTMVGVLKALGASNWSIQKIFIYQSVFILGKGILWGNVIGLGLALIQYHFSLITLSQESYFIDYVPIELNVIHILFLNFGLLVICTTTLIIPSYIVKRILPTRAIKIS